jgi:hypothetical protein
MTHADPPSPKASAGQGPAPNAPEHGAAAHAGHHHYTAEERHNEDVAHEHSDINIRAIAMFTLGLAVVTGIVFALMYGLFWVFESQAAANDARVSPVAVPAAEMPRQTTGSPTFGNAPGPQLLTNEYMAIEQHRQREDQQLEGYGWVDERAGIARMPVAEAKKLIVERGLPARADGPADPSLGTARQARGEASGGRTVARGIREEGRQ